MYRHLLIFPDGREVFSGQEGEAAILSVTVTQQVNDSQNLMPGSTCAAMMEATILHHGQLRVAAGDKVTLYRVDETDARHLTGTFYLEKPVFRNAHTLQLVGYDTVIKLDRDLTQWLTALDQWPYSVAELTQMTCAACDVELETADLPNGDFFVNAFNGEGITGRKMLQWLGQIYGRFCHSTAEGRLRFGWYTPNTSLAVAPTAGEGAIGYLQDQLQRADYRVLPVEKVQLRQNAEDVGTVYPDEIGEKNTYILENNPMLAAQDSTTLLTVAQTLYEQMAQVTYTPGKVTIPAAMEIAPGDILTVTDANGETFSFYVMKKVSNGQVDTLECTGDHRRDSTTAVNNTGYRALSGKVLNLRTDVDGLKAENKDTAGRLASISLDLTGIQNRVESQDAGLQSAAKQISTLNQRADSLSLELETIRWEGTDKVQTSAGYTFDDEGLHISRTDSQMANTLDHTGMYVRRSGETILQANDQGVVAVDITVRNFLVLGSNSRLEDFGQGRTACFFVGQEG